VQLEDVDMVGPQSVEAAVEREAQIGGVQIVKCLAVVKIETNLRCDQDRRADGSEFLSQ
jgi:hypothetical protein